MMYWISDNFSCNPMVSLSLVFDWIQQHPVMVTLITIGSVGLALLYASLVIVALTRMPADYFVTRRDPAVGPQGHGVRSLMGTLARNVVGWLLLLLGIAMLVLPGQGILTVVMGLALIDFPGKRWCLLYLLRNRLVNRAIDRVRLKASKPRLIVPRE
jgi:hypothetical protein